MSELITKRTVILSKVILGISKRAAMDLDKPILDKESCDLDHVTEEARDLRSEGNIT